MAARTFSRTAGSKLRTLRRSSARSEMMFSLVPACIEPTVTTAMSVGSTSRDTTVCSFMTVLAASTTGSTDCWGREPWAPRPWRVTFSESEPAIIGPDRWATQPAGAGPTCWPRATSGVPKRSKRPSSTIASAPAPSSSAGCRTIITFPAQASRWSASTVAAPIIQAACMSWPQAWATGYSTPSWLTPRAVEAYGSPVASSTGRASMSARRRT